MSAAQPAYQRIADYLRERIVSGDLAPGALLPTQQELSEQFDVARMTTRQALAALVNEGLLTGHQGKGMIVRGRAHMVYRPQAEYQPRKSRVMDRFMTALTKEGRTPSQTIEVTIDSSLAADVLVFEGTVVSIETAPLSNSPQNYLVTVQVDRVVRGQFQGKTFQFRVHSPEESGLKLNGKYTVEANRSDGKYTVDQFQWTRPAAPKKNPAH